jgi:hypothetical protein
MLSSFWSFSLHNPNFVSIFVVAFLVLACKTAVKYITKLPVFLEDPPDRAKVHEAHFECLRLGVDLSFLGLISGLAVFLLALKNSAEDRILDLATLETGFIIFQIFIIVVVVFFTTLFHSANEHFYLGIWVPTVIGFISVYGSALVFRFFMSNGG